MSITLKQLAAHILSLPEDVQELPAAYHDDSRYVLVDGNVLNVMYREPDGYGACVEVGDDLTHHGEAYLSSLTKVAVIGG